MSDEKTQPNTQGRQEGPPMLLARKHEDSQNQLRREKHLQHQPSTYRHATAQRGIHRERTRQQPRDHGRGRDAAQQLRRHDQSSPQKPHGAGEHHGQADHGVKLPAADAEKHPHVDGEAQAKAQGDEEETGDRVAAAGSSRVVGDVSAGKGEEEKEKGADELGKGSYNVVLGAKRQGLEDPRAWSVMVMIGVVIVMPTRKGCPGG